MPGRLNTLKGSFTSNVELNYMKQSFNTYYGLQEVKELINSPSKKGWEMISEHGAVMTCKSWVILREKYLYNIYCYPKAELYVSGKMGEMYLQLPLLH